jgi:hypothetical protein
MNAKRDGNHVPTLIAASSTDGVTPVVIYGDPITHRLYVDASAVISTSLQTDTFTASNNQTIFTASKTVVYTLYLSINGSIQTPNSDYSVTSSVATLSNGVPAGSIVVWLYSTS